MYLTELEQLVIEDENEIIEIERNLNSTLLKLQRNEEFRKKYFSNIDSDKYNAANYKIVKNNYEKEFDKMDKLSYLSNILSKIGVKSDSLNNRIDSLEMSVKIKKELIDIFNKDLSYLLYFGIISEKDALNRGFSSKYINVLKHRAFAEIEAAFDAYLDDANIDDEKILSFRNSFSSSACKTK